MRTPRYLSAQAVWRPASEVSVGSFSRVKASLPVRYDAILGVITEGKVVDGRWRYWKTEVEAVKN
jgi:hypothetical protein